METNACNMRLISPWLVLQLLANRRSVSLTVTRRDRNGTDEWPTAATDAIQNTRWDVGSEFDLLLV